MYKRWEDSTPDSRHESLRNKSSKTTAKLGSDNVDRHAILAGLKTNVINDEPSSLKTKCVRRWKN